LSEKSGTGSAEKKEQKKNTHKRRCNMKFEWFIGLLAVFVLISGCMGTGEDENQMGTQSEGIPSTPMQTEEVSTPDETEVPSTPTQGEEVSTTEDSEETPSIPDGIAITSTPTTTMTATPTTTLTATPTATT
jgi:hypothetical protein